MVRRPLILGLLLALFTGLFAAGASAASVSCAAPEWTAASMPMDSHCPDMAKGHDCALVCGAACDAAIITPSTFGQSIGYPARYHKVTERMMAGVGSRPEPPPPRMS